MAPRKKFSLELLHQILGHRSTTSLMVVDTANGCQDIELRIDPYPFYTLCQISSMNENDRPKTPLKPKAPFKWVLWTLLQQHPQFF